MAPKNPWRLIDKSVSADRLRQFLEEIFRGESSAVRRYQDVWLLNGLFEWAHFDEPWHIEALVLLYGLGADGEVYDHRSIAIRLKRSERVIQNELRPGNKSGPAQKLRSAHAALAQAPRSALYSNEFRTQLELLPRQWAPLVTAGIFTVDDLRTQKAERIKRLDGMGPKLWALIEERLGRPLA